ncbi:hypothetical protein [Microcoleus sp. FACHB-831]|uniref:hypothetical protein n=1 Tax=Microcoleus sp. FACHB-831 TaxID=2692827 RepID=UPI001A7E4B24|nr:hypothetical protein [Microcoleus sp. FACHB-831]
MANLLLEFCPLVRSYSLLVEYEAQISSSKPSETAIKKWHSKRSDILDTGSLTVGVSSPKAQYWNYPTGGERELDFWLLGSSCPQHIQSDEL